MCLGVPGYDVPLLYRAISCFVGPVPLLVCLPEGKREGGGSTVGTPGRTGEVRTRVEFMVPPPGSEEKEGNWDEAEPRRRDQRQEKRFIANQRKCGVGCRIVTHRWGLHGRSVWRRCKRKE